MESYREVISLQHSQGSGVVALQNPVLSLSPSSDNALHGIGFGPFVALVSSKQCMECFLGVLMPKVLKLQLYMFVFV